MGLKHDTHPAAPDFAYERVIAEVAAVCRLTV